MHSSGDATIVFYATMQQGELCNKYHIKETMLWAVQSTTSTTLHVMPCPYLHTNQLIDEVEVKLSHFSLGTM